MIRLICSLLLIGFCIACSSSNNPPSNFTTSNPTDSITATDTTNNTVASNPSPPQTPTIAPPQALQTFVAVLDSLGWVADTARLKKVSIYKELQQASKTYFQGFPFYTISFEESRLAHTLKHHNLKGLNEDLFKQAVHIWGYFYREKKHSSLISDGVIEAWEFDNQALANRALEQIQAVGGFIYFNTQPYFCSWKQFLIIFQTRASAFSYDQKPLFNRFTNKYSIK